MKRSIEHRIQDEAKQTRDLVLKTCAVQDMNAIRSQGNVSGLPKSEVDDFVKFNEDLKLNEELRMQFVSIVDFLSSRNLF